VGILPFIAMRNIDLYTQILELSLPWKVAAMAVCAFALLTSLFISVLAGNLDRKTLL